MTTTLPVNQVIAAAKALATGGQWRRAYALLDAAITTDPRSRALLALAAAEVEVEEAWFGNPSANRESDTAEPAADHRLPTAERLCADVSLDPGSRWDLAFLGLRRGYFDQLLGTGILRFGPDGKDPLLLAELRRRGGELRDTAPDPVRRGWAEMYLGLIADNLYGERHVAPDHYQAALRAGEAGDDLLAREALRHLGDHDHDNGDHVRAGERWGRATSLGARAGAVPGTLSQQMLLAVLARDAGDVAGATALATEIARWADAIGAVRLAAQATGFVSGADPTAAAPGD